MEAFKVAELGKARPGGGPLEATIPANVEKSKEMAMNGFSLILRNAKVRFLLLSFVLLLSACSRSHSGAGETVVVDGPDTLASHEWANRGLASVEGADGHPILSYDVTKCNLVFELEKDSPDVWAEMTVSYYVWAGMKSAGFTPIGNAKVENLTCTDEAGKHLQAEIKHGSGKYLVWYFPEITNDCKTVKVRCKLMGALQRHGDRLVLDAPWVGTWPVTVHDFQVHVVFPTGIRPQILRVCPEKHEYETTLKNADPVEQEWRHGKIALKQTQVPLTDSGFLLEYRER